MHLKQRSVLLLESRNFRADASRDRYRVVLLKLLQCGRHDELLGVVQLFRDGVVGGSIGKTAREHFVGTSTKQKVRRLGHRLFHHFVR
jgi:hypothetical protein